MKRIIALIICVICIFSLSACALTEESGYEATYEALKEAETVVIHTYEGEEDESLRVDVTDELLSLFEGKWESADGRGKGNKVVTVTVGTQHEITFFDNGIAMIYYGYANVLEKDRRHYKADLDARCDELVAYAEERGMDLDAASVLDRFFVSGNEEEGTVPGEIEASVKDKKLSIETSEELKKYLSGSWRRTEKGSESSPAVTLVLDGKYVVSLYEDETAKLSELDSRGEEKNVSYYNVALDSDLDGLYGYVEENGTAPEAKE
ncbi:MAG: hypothetical protein E7647_03635 [Ruminococcaceae bacterium]|nr:hypothetical protein [Oscillospiraceae bacterium]